ncbi:ShlB/FhaC/HecB family hemolysin secretion/activation protein [Rivularia sp. UHCC 0363]|uniref:ShlB/FhaC/HecB family hemolysin secretion/activation protein n=1 Tax=Rivularia sp. UHCC 0363 TaxID=3110244 RepID=UPI002B207337|nr:ShlB/FhaC/HecB family hemolysin secretion/activation protein [Rivularia sp. UHCC 0363]MEA5596049.1 ShlB/FhaC/HecB family hemolysin secretion/activation protein [Rivularia sp. UHCC 0363]
MTLVKPLKAEEIKQTEVSQLDRKSYPASKAVRLKSAIQRNKEILDSLTSNLSSQQSANADILFKYPIAQIPQRRQSSPQDTTKPPSTQPLPEPNIPTLPPPEELLPDITPTTPEAPEGLPQTVIVNKFIIKGSTVFSEKDFDEITKSYTNRPITFAEILQLRSQITQKYLDKGYITSGTLIPPQKFQDGTVEIEIIEGGLEDIKISGNRRLNSGYIRSRIARGTKKPLNREKLLETLQLLQLNPLIDKLSAELSAGTRTGESLLEISIRETKTFNTQLSLDNGRSPAVGSFRRQIQVSEANLFGFGDGINAGYSNTDGSNAFDFNYTLPLNPRNGTLGFSYGISDSDVIESPFNVLDIQSKSRYYELSLRQPIVQTPTKEFALGLTASRRESKASLFNGEIPFPNSPGADEDGRTRISAVRFFQDWTNRNSSQVFALRSQFSIGLDALDSTINNISPDSRFFAWRGQAQWVRLLAPDTLLLLRGDVQLADRPLVPLEQIGIGGQESVRGYRQDALLADNAVFASAEVRFPIARFSGENNLLQLAPFVDFGTAWNRGGREDLGSATDNTLFSLGLGLRLQLQQRLTARFDWGIPLIKLEGEKDTLQENGLYFSVIYNPF